MNIDELTIGQAKELAGMLGSNLPAAPVATCNPFTRFLGKNVFIRSVTHHYTGKVTELEGDSSAILSDAAWIADDGRFHDNLKSCEFSEVEPYINDVQINYGAVLDITTIETLPTKQK